MTVDKKHKKRVRARMAADGVSYTEALRRTLADYAAPPCPECGNPAGKGHSASAPCGLRILARSEGNG